MSCEDFFIKELRKRGFRLTPQRETVLSVMHDIKKPASVEEIYELVHERNPHIDLSTVYRTLELLEELNLVLVIENGERQRFFQHIGIEAPHFHLVCQNCGRIQGVDITVFESMQDELKKQFGFETDIFNITISGLCSACMKEKQNEK